MLFTSFEFIVLLVITLFVYYLGRTKKSQLLTVITASCIFYSWNHPSLLFLLFFSITVNYFVTEQILKGESHSKLFATIGVCVNLGVLSTFKYSGLIATSLNIQHGDIGQFLIAIPLPIGISFYTFQGISLVVDSYRGKVSAPRQSKPESYLHYFHYISFFPQLVAGPIVKAQTFLPQISRKFVKDIDWYRCTRLLILGFFLKMVVADNLKNYTFWMEYPYFDGKATITLFTYLFGYSMQIFADFEGYSLIAIGLAGLFGYQLPKNFNFPYISKSFSEFWRRWHISLSSFLKEYLYFPLGGNRKGKTRTYINLFITMVLGGLWHGAAWSYAVWGLIHGIFLAAERFLRNTVTDGRIEQRFPVFKILLVFTVVTFAWLTFKLPEFTHVMAYLNSMLTNFSIRDSYSMITFTLIYSLPVILYHGLYLWKRDHVFTFERPLLAVMLMLIVTNSGTTQEFIYFQF